MSYVVVYVFSFFFFFSLFWVWPLTWASLQSEADPPIVPWSHTKRQCPSDVLFQNGDVGEAISAHDFRESSIKFLFDQCDPANFTCNDMYAACPQICATGIISKFPGALNIGSSFVSVASGGFNYLKLHPCKVCRHQLLSWLSWPGNFSLDDLRLDCSQVLICCFYLIRYHAPSHLDKITDFALPHSCPVTCHDEFGAKRLGSETGSWDFFSAFFSKGGHRSLDPSKVLMPLFFAAF